MGVTLGDVDQNGTLDIASSNLEGWNALLFYCEKGPSCADAALSGRGLDASRQRTGWGLRSVDFDQDGWLDLFIHSGRITDPGAQTDQLFWNRGGVFKVYAPSPAEALSLDRNGRGVAFGDIDGDGDVDAVLVNAGEPAQVLMNHAASGHALTIALDTQSVGAIVTVRAGGSTRSQPVMVGDGYLGSSDPRVHFGLGDACSADVAVKWLDGRETKIEGVSANQVLALRRP